ncbi:MAG: secondary thiamine-phosphate synthase enzyme YjbQ [bacterium]
MQKINEISIKTSKRIEFLDITNRIQNTVSNIEQGIIHIYCPHTTAGLTINENADPDVVADIIRGLERMVPEGAQYDHSEGNSPAHIKASLMGFHQTVLIKQNKPVLGTWQAIYFCEFDGPRERKIFITCIS